MTAIGSEARGKAADDATARGLATKEARSPGRPSRRSEKREALLEGATRLFNTRGIAGVSLLEVAEELSISRSTLYYYVDDRAELAFQCYLRSCERTAEDLAAAAEAPNGFERAATFVSRALAPDRPQMAVLSDIGCLEGSQADVVKVANRRNTAALIAFLEAGVEDGSLRGCNCEVVAQSIIGMIAWAQLRPQWVDGRDTRSYQDRLLKAVLRLLAHGVAREDRPFDRDIDVDSLVSVRFNAFDRRETAEIKLDQLLEAASRLFNRNGIEATSVDQITTSLGATTGALYHYVRDKADLVARCYDRAFDLFEKFAETAENLGRDGLERARISVHLNAQAQAGRLSPLMPQPGLQALPDDLRTRLTHRTGALAKRSKRFLEQGIDDGSCLDCDTTMTSQISAGIFGWLPKWLPDHRPRSPTAVADEICALLSRGLQARETFN